MDEGSGSPQTWIGTLLKDRYRVEEQLGQGGMGTVFLATDEDVGRFVVVKVPDAGLLSQPGFRERFARETRSLVGLGHPHIVTVLDVGQSGDVPYLVLQYLAGGSLNDRLGAEVEGRQTPSQVLDWLPELAKTLDFIHGLEVIHRDVKPANILFDEHGHVFLADFGIAKVLGEQDSWQTLTGTTPGTPDYMAPETAMEESLDGRSDQYALGAVAYRALAGRVPIVSTNPLAVLLKKAKEDPEPLSSLAPGVSEELSAVVMRALSRDRETRYATCEAFAEAFGEALRAPATPPTLVVPEVGESEPAHPETVVASTPGVDDEGEPEGTDTTATETVVTDPTAGGLPLPRRRALLIAAAAIVVLALGLGAWWLLGGLSAGDGALAPTNLSLAAPEEGALVGARVRLEGRVEGDGVAEIRANGFPIHVTDGAFEGEIEAATVVRIEARSADGESRAELVRRLVVDRGPPVLSLEGDAERVTQEARVTIEGTVTDEHPPDHVLVDGKRHPLVEGRFSVPLDLSEPETRRFEVVAVDRAGNRASREVTVTHQRLPPEIVLELPPEGHLTNEREIAVRGRVERLKADSVRVGSTNLTLDDGRFEGTVALEKEGPQAVVVVARAPGDIEIRAQRNVTRDTRPPFIEPDFVIPSTAPVVNLTGLVDEDGCVVTVDERPARVTGQRFTFPSRLEPGPHRFEIVARDRAGNETKREWVVRRLWTVREAIAELPVLDERLRAARSRWAAAGNPREGPERKDLLDLRQRERELFASVRQLGSAGVPDLIANLRQEDYRIRTFCAQALGDLRAREAVTELTRIAASGKTQSEEAVEALGKIGPDASAAVETLLGLLKTRSLSIDSLSRKVCTALGGIDSHSPMVVAALREEVCAEASVALARIGQADDKTLEVLASRVMSAINRDLEHSQERPQAAAWALGELGRATPEVLEVLTQALSAKDWRLRGNAASALGHLGEATPEVADALVHCMLEDEHEYVADAAAAALGQLGEARPETIEALVTAFAHRGCDMGMDSAPRALAEIGPATLPRLRAALFAATPEVKLAHAVRWTAIEALGEIGPPAAPAVPDLIRHMGEHPKMAWQSAVAIGKIGPGAAEAVDPLRERLRSEGGSDEGAREQFVVALGRIGPAASSARPELEALLEGDDQDLHIAACTALGRIGPAASAACPKIEPLLEAESAPLRIAACIALGRIGGDLRARSTLKALTRDSRYSEERRWAAARALFEVYGEVQPFLRACCEQLEVEALAQLGPLARSAIPLLESEALRHPVAIPRSQHPFGWRTDHGFRETIERAIERIRGR
jgi:HEAT repeat protein